MIYRVSHIFLVLLLSISFFGCEPAQSESVPDSFTEDNFYKIIEYAMANYLDPDTVDINRSYVGAADASLRSLPYPLYIYPRKFFENREKLQKPQKIVPGKPIEIESDAAYLLFEPDYELWETQNKKYTEQEKKRRKKLTAKERTAEREKTYAGSKKEQQYLEDSWNEIDFSRDDFQQVVDWITKNRQKYVKLPKTYVGEDPYAENPFGMHHVFFAAANGYLQAMDPHSGVTDNRSWDKLLKDAEDSTFEGIGALLRGGGALDTVVETPLPDSPALRAGLFAGDIIRKVDKKPIDNLPLSDVVKRIRGPKDTVVELEVERQTEVENPLIRITRGVIDQRAVRSSYVEDKKIGVIKVTSFLYKSRPTHVVVEQEYRKLLAQSKNQLKGLVLDLRSNPGGFLDEAIHVAGLFLPEGKVVVYKKGRLRGTETYKNSRPPIVDNLPMIVMINSGSASASEIVASAMMDHGVALLVGDRSFGKASVQGVHTSKKVKIKLTTERYYAPQGYTVQVYGVRPDVQISDMADNSFPPAFREEDMWKHLPELEKRQEDPTRVSWLERLNSIVGDNKKVEKYLVKHKKDALKPDFMLLRALSYFEGLKKFPTPNSVLAEVTGR